MQFSTFEFARVINLNFRPPVAIAWFAVRISRSTWRLAFLWAMIGYQTLQNCSIFGNMMMHWESSVYLVQLRRFLVVRGDALVLGLDRGLSVSKALGMMLIVVKFSEEVQIAVGESDQVGAGRLQMRVNLTQSCSYLELVHRRWWLSSFFWRLALDLACVHLPWYLRSMLSLSSAHRWHVLRAISMCWYNWLRLLTIVRLAELRCLKRVFTVLYAHLLALWSSVRSEPPLNIMLLKLLGLIQWYRR